MLPAAPWDRPGLDGQRPGRAGGRRPAARRGAPCWGWPRGAGARAGGCGAGGRARRDGDRLGRGGGRGAGTAAGREPGQEQREAGQGRPRGAWGWRHRGVSFCPGRLREPWCLIRRHSAAPGWQRSAPGRTVPSQLCACSSRCPGRFPARRCWSRPTGTSCMRRPAEAITVLRGAAPRILGGRDELAGGTWLAVNSAGVLAGLTNQPSASRDPAKRSRGELPLAVRRLPGRGHRGGRGVRAAGPGRLQPVLAAGRRPGHAVLHRPDRRPAARRAGSCRRAATCWKTRRCAASRPSSSGWLAWSDAALAAAGAGAEAAALATVLLRPRTRGRHAAAATEPGCPGRPRYPPPACTPRRTAPARR